MGGDIGGSIRAPASNNGVYGFKPTCKRIPWQGMHAMLQGKDHVYATMGPICSSRETIHLCMKVILDSQPWRTDPALFPKFWTPETFDHPLKLGIMWSDGVVKPHPPLIRAMQEVASACKAAGIKLVDWEPLDHDKAWDIVSGLYFIDGGEEYMRLIADSGEPVLPLTDWIIKEQPEARARSYKEQVQVR